MEYKKLLLNTQLFAADTQSLNLEADNLKYLDFGFYAEQCGAGSITMANALAHMDEIHVWLGGEQIHRIHLADLVALQNIVQDCIPSWIASAADVNYGHLMGVRLPLHITKQGKSVTCRFTHGGVQGNIWADHTWLTVGYQFRQEPFASHYCTDYSEFTSAVAWQHLNIDRVGTECIGILLYQLTPPTCTNIAEDIDEVKVLVDDREVFHDDWHSMVNLHNDKGAGDITDDTIFGAIIDHYRWIDFQQERLPAKKLRLSVHGLTAAHACRAIPVYLQPNQSG